MCLKQCCGQGIRGVNNFPRICFPFQSTLRAALGHCASRRRSIELSQRRRCCLHVERWEAHSLPCFSAHWHHAIATSTSSVVDERCEESGRLSGATEKTAACSAPAVRPHESFEPRRPRLWTMGSDRPRRTAHALTISLHCQPVGQSDRWGIGTVAEQRGAGQRCAVRPCARRRRPMAQWLPPLPSPARSRRWCQATPSSRIGGAQTSSAATHTDTSAPHSPPRPPSLCLPLPVPVPILSPSLAMPRPSLLIACACVLLALVATQASAAKFNASTTCGFEGYDFR